MAELNIKACKNCSNYEALLAVANWMKDNKESKNYQRARDITLWSGKEFNVTEVQRDDEMTSCNGEFIVTKLGSM